MDMRAAKREARQQLAEHALILAASYSEDADADAARMGEAMIAVAHFLDPDRPIHRPHPARQLPGQLALDVGPQDLSTAVDNAPPSPDLGGDHV